MTKGRVPGIGSWNIENSPEEEGNIVESVVYNNEEQVTVDVEVVENILINNNGELSEKDKELEWYFQSELENLNHFTLLHMEPREKHLKEQCLIRSMKEQIKPSICI